MAHLQFALQETIKHSILQKHPSGVRDKRLYLSFFLVFSKIPHNFVLLLSPKGTWGRFT